MVVEEEEGVEDQQLTGPRDLKAEEEKADEEVMKVEGNRSRVMMTGRRSENDGRSA